MCLYTKLILNPKYLPNKKNGYNPPKCKDERVRYTPVGCGNCIECRKKKMREWKTRLNEEIRNDKTGKFITLTFSEESLNKLEKEYNTKDANKIATKATRRFLERWRKENKKSIKHWLITELGHKGTERLHIHGIIFTEKDKEYIEKIWKYGKIVIGYSMNERCINYIVKYVLKVDRDHIGFRGIILCSKGIGKGYLDRWDSKKNKFNGNKTKEYYRLKSGEKTALPIYYRNKIYTDEEKEELWKNKIEKNELFILGQKISNIDKKEKEINDAIKYAREKSIKLGYG